MTLVSNLIIEEKIERVASFGSLDEDVQLNDELLTARNRSDFVGSMPDINVNNQLPPDHVKELNVSIDFDCRLSSLLNFSSEDEKEEQLGYCDIVVQDCVGSVEDLRCSTLADESEATNSFSLTSTVSKADTCGSYNASYDKNCVNETSAEEMFAEELELCSVLTLAYVRTRDLTNAIGEAERFLAFLDNNDLDDLLKDELTSKIEQLFTYRSDLALKQANWRSNFWNNYRLRRRKLMSLRSQVTNLENAYFNLKRETQNLWKSRTVKHKRRFSWFVKLFFCGSFKP